MLKIIFIYIICSCFVVKGCNNASSNQISLNQVNENKPIESDQTINDDTNEGFDYHEMRYTLFLPSFQEQYHKPLDIPLSTKKGLSSFFLDIKAEEISHTKFIEPSNDNNNLAVGIISFQFGYLYYVLPSTEESDRNSFIGYYSDAATESFSDLDREIFYKIIAIGGEENPQKVLQDLISSPKHYYYEGDYVVQQKTVKRGVIELVSNCCGEQYFTLYNP